MKLHFWIATLCAVLLGCLGTETENPEANPNLMGRLVDTTGKPLAGVVVTATPINSTTEIDSTLTDAVGKFAFRRLPPNVYNLLGNYRNNTLTGLITDVQLTDTNAAKDIGTDTLRLPGFIEGQVLHNGQPVSGIPCYLSGTVIQSLSDSAGRLLIIGIPQGNYKLIYYAQSFGLRDADDTVSVLSGRISVLPPKNLDTLATPP